MRRSGASGEAARHRLRHRSGSRRSVQMCIPVHRPDRRRWATSNRENRARSQEIAPGIALPNRYLRQESARQTDAVERDGHEVFRHPRVQAGHLRLAPVPTWRSCRRALLSHCSSPCSSSPSDNGVFTKCLAPGRQGPNPRGPAPAAAAGNPSRAGAVITLSEFETIPSRAVTGANRSDSPAAMWKIT